MPTEQAPHPTPTCSTAALLPASERGMPTDVTMFVAAVIVIKSQQPHDLRSKFRVEITRLSNFEYECCGSEH